MEVDSPPSFQHGEEFLEAGTPSVPTRAPRDSMFSSSNRANVQGDSSSSSSSDHSHSSQENELSTFLSACRRAEGFGAQSLLNSIGAGSGLERDAELILSYLSSLQLPSGLKTADDFFSVEATNSTVQDGTGASAVNGNPPVTGTSLWHRDMAEGGKGVAELGAKGQAYHLKKSNGSYFYSADPDEGSFYTYLGSGDRFPAGHGIFYIEVTEGQMLTPAALFTVSAISPNGFPSLVQVVLDEKTPSRYACTFSIIEPGLYEISVSMGRLHVRGSPFTVLLSRDYNLFGESCGSSCRTVQMFGTSATIPRARIALPAPTLPARPALPALPSLIAPTALTAPVTDLVPLRPPNFNRTKYQGQRHVPAIGGSKPWGIAAHPYTKDIYVTDRDRHEVILYSYKSGIPVPVFRFGEYGEEPHQFRRPTGIAVDALNFRLIIADKDNHRISVYSIDGHFIFTFGRNGHGEGEFNYPWGVAVCPNGTYIAVADSRNYRVQLFDASGKFLRKFSVFETDPFNYKQEFHYPRGICFDNAGSTIYVSDFNLHNVFSLNLDLTRKLPLSHTGRLNLNRPQGIAVDSVGNVLVCDSKSNTVRVLSPAGRLIRTISCPGGERFQTPVDVTVCPDGFICVLDSAGTLRLI